MKVLVVDDDLAGRALLEAVFSAHGFETESAANGAEALEKARDEHMDLLVTDVLMPQMDGYQLCREWKSDPDLRDAPVVFYTGTYTSPEDQEFADDVGADLFIVKPADPDRLFAEVDSLLEHQAAGASTREPAVTEESEVLREHNERLVAKLEHKVGELQNALAALDEEARVKTALIGSLSEDIEQRKEAEQRLQRSNELLGAVVNGSPMGIVATDREGRVRVWNPRAEQLFAADEGEMLGRPYPLVESGKLSELLDIARGGGTCTKVESLSVREGVVIQAEVCTAPLRAEAGEFDGVVALIADMTERAQIDRLKQEFVQMVGHELRTPLTTIIGYGDLLASMRARGQLEPDRVGELVEKMRTQGVVLAQLVDDLVSVLQLQAQGVKLDLVPADAGELVRTRTASLRLTKRHKLVVRVPDEPVDIMCDPVQLGFALKNILANAVKFSPDGGTVEVTLDRSGGDISVSVRDQGVGIPGEDMSRIFDLFTQVDMSTTRPFGGLGMGLYLSKRIVEAHNGRIDVESVPGKGSTFTITLPVNAAPSADATTA